MDGDSTGRLYLILVLLILSGLMSALETAYSYCNKIRIRQLAESGNKRAIRTEKILDGFDDALVAILIGNNLFNTLAASTCTLLCIDLWGDSGSVISTILITVLVYILAETLPKNISKANAESVSMFFSKPFGIYMKIMKPISLLFTKGTGLLKRLISHNEDAPIYTEDEFEDIVDNVGEEGVLEPEETEIVRNTLDFCDTKVTEILCPPERILSVSLDIDREQLNQKLLDCDYSRLPVCSEEGGYTDFLRVNDYLIARLSDPTVDPKDFLSALIYVSPDTRISTAFEEMKKKKCHMAVVRGEDRQVLGLVTMEDILEEIVGDIPVSAPQEVKA